MTTFIDASTDSIKSTIPQKQSSSLNEEFSTTPPTEFNFKKMLQRQLEIVESNDSARENECVLIFGREINPSSELFVGVTRALRTVSPEVEDCLERIITDLLKEYTPSNQELKEFLDAKLCYRSLKMYLEREMTLSDSILVKIMNYIVDALKKDGFVSLYNTTCEYIAMKDLCEKYGYVLSFTLPFTKPDKKHKAMRMEGMKGMENKKRKVMHMEGMEDKEDA
jgi:hypothetical protein